MLDESVTKVMKKLLIFSTIVLLSFQGFLVNIPNVQAESDGIEESELMELSTEQTSVSNPNALMQSLNKNFTTENEYWTQKTINGDLYIGPNSILTVSGNVTVNGNIYVLGAIVSYGTFNVNGTIYANSYSWSIGGGSSVYQGSVNIRGGQNNIRGQHSSNRPLQDIPLEIYSNPIVSTNGKVEKLKGATLPIVDVTVEGKAVQLDSEGKFTIDELDIGTKESITFKFHDVFNNTITKVVPVKVVDTIPPTATIDNKGGYFSSAKTVALTISEAGNIYYTLDGTSPTATSTLYSAPIKIEKDTILKYIAVDTAGNTSEVYTEEYNFFTVDEITDTSSVLTGVAQTNSTIIVKINNEEWTTKADATGAYKVEIPVQQAQTVVKVHAISEAGIISETIELTVKDVTAPEKPEVEDVTDQSTEVTGKAEAKSTVIVKANGKEIGQAIVQDDGKFKVAIAKQKGDTELVITATDQAGNTSDETVVTVKDITAPEKPTVNEFSEQSTKVTGTAEAGSTVIVTIDNKEIGRTVTARDGSYSIEIAKQKKDTKLSITATDKAGNISEATNIIVGDNTPPEKPIVNEVTNLSIEVTGKAEAGSTVRIYSGKEEIGSETTKEDGTFTVSIPAQKAGTTLIITATDESGNISKETTVTVGAVTEKSTSRLGHLKAGESFIYPNSPGEANKKSSEEFKSSVYYIKKQATYNKELYYLLSSQPSAKNGVIGWMKASDISSHTHTGVDKKRKVFYVKGTSGAGFDVAWGGSKNQVYADLKTHKNKTFTVNLTEKVGNNIWYRGMLDGKQTWIHSNYVLELNSYVELSTSRLGHIKATNSSVYSAPFNTADKKSSESFKNNVYYIKKQATYNKELYYLLSNSPSATNGVIGWMKASDVSTHAHVGVDKKKQTLYVKGTGGASYTDAWGGGKNYVYADLKQLKGAQFDVNLTEKVGNNIWYRGMLNGKQTWVHSNYLAELGDLYKEQSVSRLGHLKAGKSLIYATPYNQETAKSSESYKDSVYYIKKQATLSGVLYYLLSTEPSATKGVIGWMKASDVSSHVHAGVDKKAKTFYVKGTGGAGFDTAWGGSKNDVYADLKPLKNELFQVNLTEKIGNNTWYRGILNGKQTWIHSSYVEEITGVYKEQSTSRLGHIKGGKNLIYTSPLDSTNGESTEKHLDRVYYIKKQVTYKGQLYYLLSDQPSATKGIVGWMKASDVSSHVHVGVDKKAKTFYVKGTGGAGFDTAWGGSKNNVHADLKSLKGEEFIVNLTEKIGNNVWYRGMLNGKQTWIHSSYVENSK